MPRRTRQRAPGTPSAPSCRGRTFRIPGRTGGPLSGLTFAVKDLFDVAGEPTGGGNPDWGRTHPAPERHAALVDRLLRAGANVVGKTITDEVSLGILGENPFHGTPRNPAAPGFVPGGSSSGSAAAVAGGLADFALGTDTGGSVRVPASFCGLYGLRTTHGRVDLAGVMPQAPSFDTAGWFARDGATLLRVSEAALDESAAPAPAAPGRVLVARDAFAFADPAVEEGLRGVRSRLAGLAGGAVRDVTLASQGLSVWARAQRTLQTPEALATFRGWIERANPRLSMRAARIAGRRRGGDARRSGNGRSSCAARRGAVSAACWSRTVRSFCLPTTPFPAPPLGLPLSRHEEAGLRIAALTCVAGLTGLPQLSAPGGRAAGRPVGLSLIGPPGSELRLAALAAALEDFR